jgi:chorismate-pyruvate lyase
MNTDNLIAWDEIVVDLIKMKDSTTLYLEALRKSRLRVKILKQEEAGSVITRISKLYFSSYDHPVIYSVSNVHKELLTADEYRLIVAQELPLGSIFTQLNRVSSITKKNITVEDNLFEEEAVLMKLPIKPLYRKRYDFIIGSRKVATIEEFFNLESLQRY